MFDDPDVAAVAAAVRSLAAPADDAARIARLRSLEELKATIAAMQAAEAVAFAESQRAAQRAAGLRADRVGTGIAAQMALALRISPHRARRYLGWSAVLISELPATFAELAAGRTTEWRAQLVARETIWLSRDDREVVDRVIAPRLEHLGDRAVEAETRRLAYRLDPQGFVDRMRAAEKDRRVSIRPAPDTMVRLTGLLPTAQGVAAYAALGRDADALVAAGDGRSRGQIMADLLVERVTGQASARDVPVEVHLVMTDRTLLEGDSEPALLDGCGPLPAGVARGLVTGPTDTTPMWLRQLYRSPESGALATMTSTRRVFGPAQRRFLRTRDQFCRTPWCGAPIRHSDHVRPADVGGPTEIENGQGLCAACNYAKQAPGWSSRVTGSSGHHEVEIRTPTGHRYRSRPPDPPGDLDDIRRAERILARRRFRAA